MHFLRNPKCVVAAQYSGPSPTKESLFARHHAILNYLQLRGGWVGSMKCVALTLAAIAVSTFSSASIAFAQQSPEFRQGFATLALQIPALVGQPVEAEQYGPNGDSLQRTTTGLMVWRKADNWTAFTDGTTTWINGPVGVVSRPNDQRLPWEIRSPGPTPTSAGITEPRSIRSAFAPSSGRVYAPDLKAMDAESAASAETVRRWVAELDAEWARVWGWRPHRSVTVYLYFDGFRMADGIAAISGWKASPSYRFYYAQNVAGVKVRDKNGGFAILLNLNSGFGSSRREIGSKYVLTHEYAHIMQDDIAGESGPGWFIEGMADVFAIANVPTAGPSIDRQQWVSIYQWRGLLPSLRDLQNGWGGYVTASQDRAEVAYGISYLAMKYLMDRVGGMSFLEVLEAMSRGEAFEVALQRITGYTIDRLDAEYRKTIPALR